MKKMRWFIHFPGDAFATQFFDCSSIDDLKENGRDFLGVNRLPNGTECWSA